jgi:hypothetical protein
MSKQSEAAAAEVKGYSMSKQSEAAAAEVKGYSMNKQAGAAAVVWLRGGVNMEHQTISTSRARI